MADPISDEQRGTSNRNVPVKTKIVDLKTARELERARVLALDPNLFRRPTGSDPQIKDPEDFGRRVTAMSTETHYWRFQKPDGTTYDYYFTGASTSGNASNWSNVFGHKVIGEIVNEDTTAPTPHPVAPPTTPLPTLRAPLKKRTAPQVKKPKSERATAPAQRGTVTINPPPQMSDEESLRIAKENWAEYQKKIQELDAKKWDSIRRALATEAPARISASVGIVDLICDVAGGCGVAGGVAKVVVTGAEIVEFFGTLYYEGIDAGGGKAGRKVAVKGVEKAAKKFFKNRLLNKVPPPLRPAAREPAEQIADRVAHIVADAFDRAFGPMIEDKGKDIIKQVLPTGPALPPDPPYVPH